MQGTNKYISSLDLKLLGAKFTAINDTNQQLNRNLAEIRKSKIEDLPSIYKSSHEHD